MADQSDIDLIKNSLPDDSAEDGWDDTFIGTLLDSGVSTTKVSLAFWSGRVGKLSTAIDVSESGSSRSLSRLFDQAKIAYDMWLDKSKAEDALVIAPDTRRPVTFGKMKRV